MASEILTQIYLFGFLICLLFSITFGFIILISKQWLQPYLSAKFTNGLLECQLTNAGTCIFSALKRHKAISFNNKAEPVQEYVRIKKEKDETTGKTTKTEERIKDLFYPSNIGGVKIGFRREGDCTFIDDSGKPAPIDQAWLEKIFNVYYSAIMKMNKLFKKKALNFPFWIIIVLILMAFGGFVAWRMVF